MVHGVFGFCLGSSQGWATVSSGRANGVRAAMQSRQCEVACCGSRLVVDSSLICGNTDRAGPAEAEVNSAPANTHDTIACMSQAPYGPGPAAPSGWSPQGPPPSSGPSRKPTIIAIVIALIAVAVAIAAWFRPAPKAETPAEKTYSEQEIADAKKAVCDAYGEVIHTLDVNKRKSSVNPADNFAIVVNTRLAVQAVADYLLNTVNSQPALKPELSSAIRGLATAYQQIVLKQIGDADQSELDASYQRADEFQSATAQACK